MKPTRLASTLPRLANRRLLFATGLPWLALALVLFQWTGRFSLAAVKDACGSEAPDVMFAPTPEQTESFLTGCGTTGLEAYRDLQLVDLFYPAASAAVLVVVLALLLRNAAPRLAWLAALPVATALGDYLENAAAWVLIGSGPDTPPAAALAVFQVGSGAKVVLSWAAWLAVTGMLVARLPAFRRGIVSKRRARTTPEVRGSL